MIHGSARASHWLFAIVASAGSTAFAGSFQSPNDLVVVRLGAGGSTTIGTTDAEPVFLDEYDLSGATPTLVNTVSFASSGPNAFTLPSDSNHDALLSRSVDTYSIVLGGYRADQGSLDPSAYYSSAAVPRVIASVPNSGIADTTTALTDSYDQTSIRGVATINSKEFWVAGDNGGGLTTSGGLRYVDALGASTSTNLSQVQGTGGLHTPDNIRSVGIFGGQLYDSSGSNTSVGKATFQVGTGLPTSGAQTLTTLTSGPNSTNQFFFADLSPTVSGMDTLYITTSNGEVLEKWSLNGNTWVMSPHTMSLNGIETLTAAVSGSTVTLYAGTSEGIFRYVDATGYNQDIPAGDSFGSAFIPAATNTEFRGLAFAPTITGDVNLDGVVNGLDISQIAGHWLQSGVGVPGDVNSDGVVNGLDISLIAANWLHTAGGGAGTAVSVPEPSTLALLAAGLFGGVLQACWRRRFSSIQA